MSINVFSKNLRDVESMLYKKKLTMIPKDKLPQRSCGENYNSDEFGVVAMNRDGNKAEIQEMAKLLSQSKTPETKKDKKVKVVSTAAKAEDTKEEDEEHTTSDKSTLTDVGSTLAKEGLYRYTGSKLLKPNPYLVAMTLLGVDFEEDGNALKKGAETGKIGDFGEDYKNYFNNMWDKAGDSELSAAWEGFNLPANVISIGLQDSLQTIGAELSKVLGKEPVVFIGSGVSAVGTAFNAMGDVAGDSIKGTVGMVKNLVTGDFDGIADSAKDIYNGVKDSVLDVTDAVVDVAEDGANLVKETAVKTYDIAKDGANYVADAAEEVGNAIVDTAEEVGNGIAYAAEEAGDAIADFAEDTWDDVEDFFDSIF